MKTGMFSTPRRRLLLLAAVGVLAGLFFLWPRGPAEPVYRGKTLTRWLHDAYFSGNPLVNPETHTAMDAIGTNALPFLLKEFTRPVSPRRESVAAWLNRHPSFKIHLRTDEERGFLAALGLLLLGTNAAPAAPGVILCLDDTSRSNLAFMILVGMRTAAKPHVLTALRSPDIRVVTNALVAIQFVANGPGPSSDAVAQALRHADASVRAAAVRSWSSVMDSSEDVVPALQNMTKDTSPLVVQEASNQLVRQSRSIFYPIRIAASNALLTLPTNAPPPRANAP